MALPSSALGHRIVVDRLEHKGLRAVKGVLHVGGHPDIVGRRGNERGHEAFNPLGLTAADGVFDLPRNVRLADQSGAGRVFKVVVEIGDLVAVAHDPALQSSGRGAGGVAGDAVEHVGGQIKPRAVPLEHPYHPHALGGVAVAVGAAFVQRGLSGVAVGSMAEIMPQRDCLGQVLIEPKRPRDGARDLRNLQRVRQRVR